MAFSFPDNPTVGQQVTGPGGQVYQWDGVKWVAVGGGGGGAVGPYAPLTNPSLGQNNYLAMDSPVDGGTY